MVSEWFKEHAWKVCVRQKRTEGSNPSLSASFMIMVVVSVLSHHNAVNRVRSGRKQHQQLSECRDVADIDYRHYLFVLIHFLVASWYFTCPAI